MSNPYIENIIQSGKIQSNTLLFLYQYFFIDQFLRKNIIGTSGINS